MNQQAQYFEQYSQENAGQLVNGSFNPQTTAGICLQSTLSFESMSYKNNTYKWSATQYNEQPDFLLHTPQGNIWVQVSIGLIDLHHHQSYLSQQKDYPVTKHTAQKILANIVDQGYLNSYFSKKLKLKFTQNGKLIEI